MKKLRLVGVLMSVGLSLAALQLTTTNALAQDPIEKENIVEVDTSKFPELLADKYGIVDAENLLDSNSANYDPSLHFDEPGTRFGPLGERNLDFYREMNVSLDSSSEYLEMNLKTQDPWPGDTDYGTAIGNNNGVQFVQAYQKVYTGIELDQDGDVLYAPTMIGPDRCRLEALIRYRRISGVTTAYFSVFEHSTVTAGNGTFTNHYMIGQASFHNRYVNGNDEVITRITKTGSDPN